MATVRLRQTAQEVAAEQRSILSQVGSAVAAEARPAAAARHPGAAGYAAFVTALRRAETTGADPRSPRSRGGPLLARDEEVRQAVTHLGSRVDGEAVLDSWRESLSAPAWPGPEVWVHGDLLPGNLLVVDGRLAAVIDFGCLTVGDPACDLLPAWNVFAGDSRARFRAELEVDDASWLRGRGWALCQAVVGLPYYWDTNPGWSARPHARWPTSWRTASRSGPPASDG
jgi:aminoglycoside phosphotransferase (APT) family kinase protein